MSLNVENLDRLISHLEGLPEGKFDMRELFKGPAVLGTYIVPEIDECGTAACIAGHCAWAAGVPVGDAWGGDLAAAWIGIDWKSEFDLFAPHGFRDGSSHYPLPRAIRTLKYMRSEFLRTGNVVVDWDAPEPVEKAAWTAPKATERALPEEAVSLLRPTQHSEVRA